MSEPVVEHKRRKKKSKAKPKTSPPAKKAKPVDDRPEVLVQKTARSVELMARFVVSLEDPEDAAFPIHEALQSWDALGRLAFSTWAMRVWWVP